MVVGGVGRAEDAEGQSAMQERGPGELPSAECLPQQRVAGGERNLVNGEGGEVVANIVVAVAVLRAKTAGQRGEDAERGERKQAAV